jgi:hypothetical protein
VTTAHAVDTFVTDFHFVRLKNADGTKTTLALGNCIAMQRLVLTGMVSDMSELLGLITSFAVQEPPSKTTLMSYMPW